MNNLIKKVVKSVKGSNSRNTYDTAKHCNICAENKFKKRLDKNYKAS